jgi:HAMP domain-containing protein
MTRSRSGTRSPPKHQCRPPAARRYRQTANSGSATKVTFCVRGVITPLLRMRDAMLRLAHGDLDIKVDERQRAKEIGQMAEAVGVFHTTLVERHQLNRETRLLSDLNEWLQCCNSLGELYQLVAEFLGGLLPACAGSLYIYAYSRDVLERA